MVFCIVKIFCQFSAALRDSLTELAICWIFSIAFCSLVYSSVPSPLYFKITCSKSRYCIRVRKVHFVMVVVMVPLEYVVWA